LFTVWQSRSSFWQMKALALDQEEVKVNRGVGKRKAYCAWTAGEEEALREGVKMCVCFPPPLACGDVTPSSRRRWADSYREQQVGWARRARRPEGCWGGQGGMEGNGEVGGSARSR
jgi:hypothetical protein